MLIGCTCPECEEHFLVDIVDIDAQARIEALGKALGIILPILLRRQEGPYTGFAQDAAQDRERIATAWQLLDWDVKSKEKEK